LRQRFAVNLRCSLLATLSLVITLQLWPQPRADRSQSAQVQRSAEMGIPVLEAHPYKEYNGFGQVWAIQQDKRGVMYFGESAGNVIEYDGVSWRKIVTPSSAVRSLGMDAEGAIWIGGVGTFGYLAPDKAGVLQYVEITDKVPAEARKFTTVWQVLPTPQGVFFRTIERLYRWDGKAMHVWAQEPHGRFQALSSVRGHIYTSQNGIGLEEIVGDELRPLPGGSAYANATKLYLYPYDEKRIIVSSRDGELTLYDGQSATPFPNQASEFLRKNHVYTSALLSDGSFCVTTLTGGAVILDHNGALRQIIGKPEGLLDSDSLSAYMDRDGALWLGTLNGIARVEIDSPVSIFSRNIINDAVRFQGSLYTAVEGGSTSVERLGSDPQTHRPAFEPIASPAQTFAFRVFRDPSGKTPDQLLAATSTGVMKLQGNGFIPTIASLNSLADQSYWLLQSTKSPNRVFVAHNDGVGSMRWDGQRWIDEGRLPKTLYEARSLAEDSEGYLWVAGAEGSVLRIKVAETGLQNSSAETLGRDQGVPPGLRW